MFNSHPTCTSTDPQQNYFGFVLVMTDLQNLFHCCSENDFIISFRCHQDQVPCRCVVYVKRSNVRIKQHKAHSCNHCCSRRSVSITEMYSKCLFVALCIQYSKRMCSVIQSCMACPALEYFSSLHHKRHDSRKRAIEQKCVF